MPRYNYVALDGRGQELTGLVDAFSSNDAIGQLRQAGYFPTNVYEEGAGGAAEAKTSKRKIKAAPAERKARSKNIVLFRRKSVKPKVLMTFTRQLATLIDAGLPLLRGLRVLEKQERNVNLKRILAVLATSI